MGLEETDLFQGANGLIVVLQNIGSDRSYLDTLLLRLDKIKTKPDIIILSEI